MKQKDIKFSVFGRAPEEGSGYPLQVLAIRASWLWAFRYYPSRSAYICKNSPIANHCTFADPFNLHMYLRLAYPRRRGLAI